jgi:hypothetical protein
MSRDREDGRATGQPQGVGSEAYPNGTSQGPTPEDARKDGQIRGRSKRLMKHPGQAGWRQYSSTGAGTGPLGQLPEREDAWLDSLSELAAFHAGAAFRSCRPSSLAISIAVALTNVAKSSGDRGWPAAGSRFNPGARTKVGLFFSSAFGTISYAESRPPEK